MNKNEQIFFNGQSNQENDLKPNNDLEIGNLDGMTDEEVAEQNKQRISRGYEPLRRATAEEKKALDVAHQAIDQHRGVKYRPAVISKSGKIFLGGHSVAIHDLKQAGETLHRRGWVTPDGKFLNLLDVARLEMKK